MEQRLYLIKGKKANEGEIRKWKSGHMMKVGKKWISVEQKNGKWVKVEKEPKKTKPKGDKDATKRKRVSTTVEQGQGLGSGRSHGTTATKKTKTNTRKHTQRDGDVGIGPGKHVPDEQVKEKEPVITDEENTLIAKMLGRPEEEITGKKRKPSKAKNNALKIIEEKKNAGIALSRENFTPEEIEALENFQGIGGTKATGSARAVLTEYYTPKSVISKIWQLLAKYISPGSKVLEPSAGTGTFARNPIANDYALDMIEYDETTSTIAKILHPDKDVKHMSFEEMFMDPGARMAKKEYGGELYDGIIGNPPYGVFNSKYKGMGEGKGVKTWQEYFIKRGLDTLKEGGTLAMVVPSSFLDGGLNSTKSDIAKKAAIVEAYRLPNNIFPTTDVGTDIIVLRKQKGGEVEGFHSGNYFKRNPDAITGKLENAKDRYGKDVIRVVGDEASLENIDTKTIREPMKQEVKDAIAESMLGNQNAKGAHRKKAVKEKAPTGKPEKKARVTLKDKLEAVKEKAKKSGRLTKAQFLRKYSMSFDEKDMEIYKHTDTSGYINVSKVPFDPDKMAMLPKGEYTHIDRFLSGDMYEREVSLRVRKDDVIEKHGIEYYTKLYQKVTDAIPEIIPMDKLDIPFLSPFARTVGMNERMSLAQMFVNWLRTTGDGKSTNFALTPLQSQFRHKKTGINVTISEIYDYYRGARASSYRGQSKSEVGKEYTARREVAESLFKFFYSNAMLEEDKATYEQAWNRKYNKFRKQDFKKVPVFAEGINTHFKDKDFNLHDIQIEGAAFLNTVGTGVMAYGVGVGKTLAGALATVSAVQTGKAKKPLILVPKAVHDKWATELSEAFPEQKFEFVGNMRDWDTEKIGSIPEGTVTVATYQALDTVSFSDETMKTINLGLQEEIKIKGEDSAFAEARLKEQADTFAGVAAKTKTEKYIELEKTGFDHVTVDEAHNFKNLFSRASAKDVMMGGKRVAVNEYGDITGGQSERAKKLYAVTKYIKTNNNGRGVFLLSATPFTNSPLEVYNILSYVGESKLREYGINNVHTFMQNFADIETQSVVSAKGTKGKDTGSVTVETKNIVKGFRNLPFLQSILREYMDYRTPQEAGVRPPINTQHLVELPMSPLQRQAMVSLQKIVDNQSSDDPAAYIVGLNAMRMAALSPHLIPQYRKTAKGDEPLISGELHDLIHNQDFVDASPKIKFSLDFIGKMLKEKPDIGHVVYMPMGIDRFEDMRAYLAKEHGIKPENIGIIRSVSSDAEKDRMEEIKDNFNDENHPLKVIIGSSTIKEGIDLNGNTATIHNLMLDWNPTDPEQVEGRIVRQGNKQWNTHSFYPVLSDSVDAVMFQKFREKSGRISDLFSYKGDSYEFPQINYEEVRLSLIKDPSSIASLLFSQLRAKGEDALASAETKGAGIYNGHEKYTTLRKEEVRKRENYEADKKRFELSQEALQRLYEKTGKNERTLTENVYLEEIESRDRIIGHSYIAGKSVSERIENMKKALEIAHENVLTLKKKADDAKEGFTQKHGVSPDDEIAIEKAFAKTKEEILRQRSRVSRSDSDKLKRKIGELAIKESQRRVANTITNMSPDFLQNKVNEVLLHTNKSYNQAYKEAGLLSKSRMYGVKRRLLQMLKSEIYGDDGGGSIIAIINDEYARGNIGIGELNKYGMIYNVAEAIEEMGREADLSIDKAKKYKAYYEVLKEERQRIWQEGKECREMVSEDCTPQRKTLLYAQLRSVDGILDKLVQLVGRYEERI